MKKIDYRHYICIAITIGCLLCTAFLFTNSINRIIESFRDFGLSIAYYFCELFGIEGGISVTVNELPSMDLFPTAGLATVNFPATWASFKEGFAAYWQLWISKDNALNYLSALGDGLYIICYALLIALPLIIVAYLLFGRILKAQNNDCGKDSKPLKVYKKLTRFYRPVKGWCISFKDFVKSHSCYYIIWLLIWALNFNLLTIFVEFLAYYFYFCISFDISSLYLQIYKLVIDLATPICFIPWYIWLAIAVIVLEAISRNIAYSRLAHRERCNRGFINERGVITIVYGTMGTGKTALITDMALSAEAQLRDQAFEIILECDMKFPNFPWTRFEYILRRGIEQHKIYDVWSCKRFIQARHNKFNKKPCPEQIYGYDYERYGLTYNDNLKVIDIWEALQDYACAYFIYTVQSSLLVSNYSIRTDNLISDLGNFPLWNADFFKRDSRLIDSYSRHSHILDQDMLRLGKRMIENNPNRNAFGFGVYVYCEVDKERKNNLENKEIKASSDECNQKNDLFNALWKMSRHACVVANRVFVKFFADLQRPESLGADARELGEVVYIDGQTESRPLLPFFSPFYLFEIVYQWLKGRFDKFYQNYRYTRGDNVLIEYLFKNIVAAMSSRYEKTCNLFGSSVLTLSVESGKMDGEPLKRKYYRQSKKIWSKRYSTDCLSGFFAERGKNNCVGINDLKEYADVIATNEELLAQNSHFQNEINSLSQTDENG
ncbi:MAG: hypothetical protein LUD27_00975 [Clostridia bacterium]|nr:hypothetical protein [Clostridia bacterium]